MDKARTGRLSRRHARRWMLAHACLCGLLATACARPHAAGMPDGPALAVPAPPPHEVAVSGTEVPPLVPLPDPPARTPIRPRQAAPRPEPPKADPGKTEAPRTEAQPPGEPARAPDEPAKPATTLQTAPAAEQTALERAVRTTLGHAMADLNRIDYRALNTNARTQYDTAKRFIRQADEAIRAQNLVLARSLADKAAAIAAQQAGR